MCGSEYTPEDNFCRICGAELTHAESDKPRFRPAPSNHYTSVGIFLVIFGGIIAAASLLMEIVPTLALGLASLLMGAITLYMPEPFENLADRLASNSSIPALLNIENLLEDLSINEKGVYIPASGLGVCPKVFVPLTSSITNKRPPRDLNNSNKVFITLDTKTREGGLLFEAPGSNLLSELERALKLDMSNVDVNDLKEKLESGLKLLEIAKSTRLELRDGRTITFQVELNALRDLEVRLSKLTPRVVDQIGTPVSSAIAAAISKSTGEYVAFRQVLINPTDKKITAALELVR
jgi:hypothetical protein